MKFGDSLIYQRFRPGHYTGHGYAITRNQPQPDDWCFEIDNEVLVCLYNYIHLSLE